MKTGVPYHRRYVTKQMADKIRKLVANGVSPSACAVRFQLSAGHIRKIVGVRKK